MFFLWLTCWADRPGFWNSHQSLTPRRVWPSERDSGLIVPSEPHLYWKIHFQKEGGEKKTNWCCGRNPVQEEDDLDSKSWLMLWDLGKAFPDPSLSFCMYKRRTLDSICRTCESLSWWRQPRPRVVGGAREILSSLAWPRQGVYPQMEHP